MIYVLREMVDCVSGLGFDVIKVTADDEKAVFEAVNKDRTAVMKAETKAPLEDVRGVFGLSNLNVLGGILSLSSMRGSDVTVEVKNANDGSPEELVFNGKDGARAVYRLMGEAAVPKQPNFRTPAWDVTIEEVSKGAFIAVKEQAAVFGAVGGNKYTPSASDGKLVFEIGDTGASNHNTRFVVSECDGELTGTYKYQIPMTITALALTNSKALTLHYSSKGVMQIEFGNEDESQLSVNVIFPGHNA